MAQAMAPHKHVTADDLATLPSVVQRYLTYTGIIDYPWIDTVRLTYSGQFRLGADKPWMPVRAQQVYRTNLPAFQWKARFRMFGLPLIYGQDTFVDGQAHMFGKLAGLFTLFDVKDANLLQGTMMRYLQEAIWFPTAYLHAAFTWTGIDDHSADVTFTYGGEQVTGRFYFDDAGRVLTFVGERYNDAKAGYYPWATPMVEYAPINGLNLPLGGSGVWQFPEGDLPYITLRIDDIAYNVPVSIDAN